VAFAQEADFMGNFNYTLINWRCQENSQNGQSGQIRQPQRMGREADKAGGDDERLVGLPGLEPGTKAL